MDTFDIRQIEDRDLGYIEKHFYNYTKHISRFEKQKNNEGVYLIAWKGTIPVAHVLAKWKGSKREAIASILDQCPEIEGMYVMDDYRRQGIARQLMQKAIILTVQQGYSQLGLAVRSDNIPAISLYESLGFKDLGIDEYVISWPYINKEGVSEIHEETCIYMVKSLERSELPTLQCRNRYCTG